MIGFHVKSPFDGIEHYVYGDEDWRVRVSPRGGGDARYSNRHATAYFGYHAKQGEIRAENFINHPGDIAIFARIHLALTQLPNEITALDSAQVRELIGEYP